LEFLTYALAAGIHRRSTEVPRKHVLSKGYKHDMPGMQKMLEGAALHKSYNTDTS